jgi:hypothetical protein
MTTPDTPWEPPVAGTEAEHLTGALDRLRFTFRWKAGVKLAGEPLGAAWEGVDWDADPDWEFTSAPDDSPDELYAVYDAAVDRSRARCAEVMADGGLDQPVHITGDDGRHASLRRLLCDLVEEYGRHTGHADLLREAVDGLVGEDPPPGWRP